MQQNSTDFIAKSAWTTTLERWKEFMLLPAIVSAVFFAITGLGVVFSNNYGWGDPSGLIFFALYIAYLVFISCFYTAVSKWCSEIYAGTKIIDIEAGLRYGLSRFWGKLGTTLLTLLKVCLWSFLLVIPGIYKALMYSQSIKISELEGVSGGDANRLSEKLISNAGILRTLGNYMAIQVVSTLFLYIYMSLVFVVAGTLGGYTELATPTVVVGGILFTVGIVFMTTFLMVFTNYQYLIYKDENKLEMAKMVKTLKSLS